MGEQLPHLFWRADAAGRRIWSSREWTACTGQTPSDSLADGWLAAVYPEDHELTRAAWSDALASGSLSVEHRLRDVRSGDWRWFQTTATPSTDGRGAITEWMGACTGIHDLRGRLERQDALMRELRHRIRNLMAVVQAIGTASAEGGASAADYQRRFGRRLAALGRAQTLLSGPLERAPIRLEALVRGELGSEAAVYAADHPGKVTLEGSAELTLRPAVVQILTLALHELVDNACEHGALSQRAGRLSVGWTTLPEAPTQVRLEWRETGVTHAAPPGPAGFGREMIEQALAFQTDAAVDYVFTEDGLVCTIEGDFGAP